MFLATDDPFSEIQEQIAGTTKKSKWAGKNSTKKSGEDSSSNLFLPVSTFASSPLSALGSLRMQMAKFILYFNILSQRFGCFRLPLWPWPFTNNNWIWNVLEQPTNRNVFLKIFNCGVNVKTKDCAGLLHHCFHGKVSWPVPQLTVVLWRENPEAVKCSGVG